MFNKNFLLFWILVAFFVLQMSMVFFVYIRWDHPLPEEEASVEISLPVVPWDNYLQLSKSLK